MLEEVYDYLNAYGLTDTELEKIEQSNEKIYFVNVNQIKKNICFLKDKYLTDEDITRIIDKNPYILTEHINRFEELDEIYKVVLSIDYESMIELIKSNPETYTASPIELQKIIDFLKNKNCTIDTIRNLFIKNPKIISMKFEDFEKAIKFN